MTNYHRKPLVLGPIPASLARRLVSRTLIADPDECWTFTGYCCDKGYGRIGLGKDYAGHERSVVMAHRVSYSLFVGPIPDTMEIDHTCDNPSCINPAHLEPVTTQENNRRKYDRSVAQTDSTDAPF